MKLESEGFFRPEAQIALDAQDRNAVASVCPGVELEHRSEAEEAYHPVWGPVRLVATGYSTDPEIRHRGASGGVISAIAIWLLETGKVSFVLQTASDPMDPIGNVTRPSHTRLAVLEAAGSRYGPSSPLENLEGYLSKGSPFAFIGKPCDVAALRRMARTDSRIDRFIPYKISFFCAGVPSRLGTLELLAALNVDQDDVTSFRYRGNGWPGYARAIRRNGGEETMDYNASWGRILNRWLQFRCKLCADGTGEFADLVGADAWYSKDGYPDFADRDGRSLIVARTRVGEQLLATAQAAGIVECSSIPVDEVEAMQPFQALRKKSLLARILAVHLAGRSTTRYRHFALLRLSFTSSPVVQARNFLGTLRRMSAILNAHRKQP